MRAAFLALALWSSAAVADGPGKRWIGFWDALWLWQGHHVVEQEPERHKPVKAVPPVENWGAPESKSKPPQGDCRKCGGEATNYPPYHALD